jgi:hypothetical protein
MTLDIEKAKENLQNFLNNLPEEQKERAKKIQWRCDQLKRRYKDNPTGLMIAYRKLLMEQLYKLQCVLKGEKVPAKEGKRLELKGDKDADI